MGLVGGRRVAHIARRGITILAVLAVAAVGFVAQVPAPAVATVDPVVYQGVYAGFDAVNARAGGSLRCPAGRKAVAGGGYLPSSEGALTALAPTADGGGWQMIGVGPGGGSLIVTARCVARLRVFS